MKVTNGEFVVLDFDLRGFLNIPKEVINFLRENIVDIGVQWGIANDFTSADLLLAGQYKPKNKVDFSTLACYQATKNYYIELNGFDNETLQMGQVVKDFVQDLEKGYNDRIKGTNVHIKFPIPHKEKFDQLCQYILDQLHQSIEKMKH